MVPIKKNLVSILKRSVKCPYKMTPKYVIIHNTANDASASNEVSYMRSNNNEVSFHYAVDDKEIVQGVSEDRNTWNAGDGGEGAGNRTGISIEICYSKSGGTRFDKAEKNAAEFAASLLKKYGWDTSHLKKHQDFNGKYCPHRTLDRGWDRFIKMVQSYMTSSTSSSTSTSTSSSSTKTKDFSVDVKYKVKAGGKWYPEVKNLTDYAGVKGVNITDVAIKVTKGSVKYRVHIKGGSWLPYVTGYNTKDSNNGYAGNGKAIDMIEVIYTSPKGYKSKKAKYRVAPFKRDFWPWQTNTDKSGSMDGYAGAAGTTIDRFQITIA